MGKIEVGTISHGTLRTEDLLRAFAAELERIKPGHDLVRESRGYLESGLLDDAESQERYSELVSDLQDALDATAPAGMYFGPLEGDGADFGFWLNEDGRRAALADDFARNLERRTRDNGDSYLCLKDEAPEWMREAVRAAHGDMLPDDWRYRFIGAVVEDIAERLRDDCTTDLNESARDEIIDSIIPVYTMERLQWLASHLSRSEYCDQAREDGLVSDDASMADRVAAGMYQEVGEIYSTIVDALNSAAE